jgi:acetyltransferase-like isoleucine patch superfamily enzyme
MSKKLFKLISSRSYEDFKSSDLTYIIKKGLFARLRGFAFTVFNLRHIPGFMLGPNVKHLLPRKTKVGKSVFFGGNSYIELFSSKPSSIGSNVTIREGAWIQCRSGLNEGAVKLKIEDGVYIGPGAVIGVGGEVIIGSNCSIGARLSISAEEHQISDGSYVSNKVERRGIKINKNCWLGNNVTVLDGVTIGENSVIGACSLVTKDIPENSVAFGVPAKVIKEIKTEN